jgi:uncharacterized OB-fold protein
MSKQPSKREETLGGTIVHGLPFPNELTPESLEWLRMMQPIRIEQDYSITYLHSYGQDSPFFAGLTNKVLLGTQEATTGYTYATPRGHGMYDGLETKWVPLPHEGKVHAFTVCYFGSEEFLPETPFILALIEFEGADTLFLTRLLGLDPDDAGLHWIGMKVQARFLRNAKLKPTDVYFVPVEE